MLAVPATLLVLLFLLIPLAFLLRFSFNRFVPGELMTEAFTAENYAKFFHDGFYRSVLWTTLWMSAAATAICLLAGYPVAYYLARALSGRAKGIMVIAVVLPLLMGNAVRTAAWMVLLGDRGAIAAALAALGVTDRIHLMYTPAAVLIGLTSVLLPFMILTLQSVLEAIDPALEEAARSLGGSNLRSFVRVVLPLSSPGILAGCMLCFTLSMNAYATPVLIGGPKFHMMAPEVYQQVAKAMDWPFGAALAFILMLVTLVLSFAATRLAQRHYRRWTA